MTNEKAFFEEPKIEVIRFEAEDIITTSRETAELDEIED